MKTFTRAFVAAAGAVLGASTTVLVVSYMAGKITESRVKSLVDDLRERYEQATEDLIKEASTRADEV